VQERTYSVLHLFSGLGGAALGFQDSTGEWRGVRGTCHTLAGIDSDPEACADFAALTGAPAVQMDLFSRADYEAYHGAPPPAGWREASPGDIRAATGGLAPDVVFLSPPCKGFSGLLPKARAASAKYRALNRLVPRGLRLTLAAFWDDLPAIILLENVPRITSRGSGLLAQVRALLRAHGYACSDGYHDCGEIGGLAQRRRRYLLIARNVRKVPAFVYQPPQRRVRAIGEVLELLPLPEEPAAGPLHRLPRLQWLTWVRLALIPAGGDWRDLDGMTPDQYRLQPRDNRHPAVYQISEWGDPAPCVTGSRFGSGAPAISDPRTPFNNVWRVTSWTEPAGAVTSGTGPSSSAVCVADPRLNHTPRRGAWRVVRWDEPSGAVVSSATRPGGSNCSASVADPRLGCKPRSGAYRVLRWEEAATTVTGAGDIHSQGAAAVADPRTPDEADRPAPPPVIIAEDGTWHRPLTTLELAALQGLPTTMPDGRPLVLAGESQARWRQRIGNAVPPPAARAMAETILVALLQSAQGTWALGATPIWVREGDEAPCSN